MKHLLPTTIAAVLLVGGACRAKDSTVPLAHSGEMVEALNKPGGTPTYTEYPDDRHDAWTRVYKNNEFWIWNSTFSQYRKHRGQSGEKLKAVAKHSQAPRKPPAKQQKFEIIQHREDGPLRSRASTAFPKLTVWPGDEQDQLNQAIEKCFLDRYKPASEQMFKSAADAEKSFADDPAKIGASFYDWTIKNSHSMKFVSPHIVSILGTHYEYTGGAHGNTTYFPVNYWIRNDRVERIRLAQIFKAMFLWRDVVDRLIRHDLAAKNAHWLKDVPKKKLLATAFTFSERGIEFHYPPYMVGPYYQGSFHVFIPLAAIKRIIRPSGPMARGKIKKELEADGN